MKFKYFLYLNAKNNNKNKINEENYQVKRYYLKLIFDLNIFFLNFE